MDRIIIFYDLDEVLNWFSKGVIDIYNKESDDDYDWKDNKSWWWDDAPYGFRNYFEDMLERPGIFYNMEPQLEGIKFMEKLIAEGYDIRIVTAPKWNRNCMVEKLMWIYNHLPFIDPDKQLIYTVDKSLLAGPNRILFDDNSTNLTDWAKAGGIPIALERKFNEEFEGLKVSTHEEFYFLVKQLIKNIEYGKEQPNLKQQFRIDLTRGDTVGKTLL